MPARSFGDTPIRRDGVVLGAVCEEGTVRLDPRELLRAVVDLERDRAIHAARALLGDESSELRGSRWIGDVWRRIVVVVAEILDEPWSALAVCNALRRLGASPVVVVALVASSVARAAFEGAVDELSFTPPPTPLERRASTAKSDR